MQIIPLINLVRGQTLENNTDVAISKSKHLFWIYLPVQLVYQNPLDVTEVKSHVSFPWSLGDDKHMKAERERTNPQNIIHYSFS